MKILVRFLSALVFGIGLSVGGWAQVTFTISTLPESTPPNSQIYMATSLNGWQPQVHEFMFAKNEFGQLELTLDSIPEGFEYKISRGSWASVEVDSIGADVPNRTFSASQGRRVEVPIMGWRDRVAERLRPSTASKNVSFLPTSIEMPQFGKKRTVRVYFPPNYASRQGFPVIYMFDGQNLFDNSTSFSGEWGIDEILDSLYFRRGFSAIVVGIYHGEADRISELTPWPNDEKQGGEGKKMAQFVIKTLKPYMDKHYRTYPDRDNTIIAGSSLGGLMSLYMSLEHPNVFGKAMIFSPSLWWSDKAFEQVAKYKKRHFQKFYLYAGGLESNDMLSQSQRVNELLKSVGFATNELLYIENPEGKHNEQSWGPEFNRGVGWLFDLTPTEQ